LKIPFSAGRIELLSTLIILGISSVRNLHLSVDFFTIFRITLCAAATK